jgi:hypothetical protein
MYDELELKKKYKVIRKLDIDLDEYLEFVNDDMICYSYEVENDKYLVIVVEDLSVLYLILNKEYEVVDEYILKDEELNDLMYI